MNQIQPRQLRASQTLAPPALERVPAASRFLLLAFVAGASACAHARCEDVAVACPGGLAVCTGDGEAACSVPPADQEPRP